MLSNLLALKGVLLGGWFIVFFIAERLRQSAPAPRSTSRLSKNIGLWLLTVLLSYWRGGTVDCLGGEQCGLDKIIRIVFRQYPFRMDSFGSVDFGLLGLLDPPGLSPRPVYVAISPDSPSR